MQLAGKMAPREICALCDTTVNNRTSKGIICVKCDQTYHRDCANITMAKYDEIQKKKIKWLCNVCILEKKDKNPSASDEPLYDKAADKHSLGEINKKLDMILQQQNAFKYEIAEVKTAMADLRQTVSNLITENVNIRNENQHLKERVAKLEDAMGNFQQQQINNNVLIYGIQKNDNENLGEIVQNIAKAVNIEIKPTEIQATFRGAFSSKSSLSTPALHVNFNKNATKMKLISAIKGKLLDTSVLKFPYKRPIYINEQLTTSNQLLYKKARDLRRAQKKNSKPYVDQEMIVCIATRDFWFSKLQADQGNTNIRRELKYWQNKTTSMKRSKRKEYHGKKFKDADGDVRKTWNCIKEVLHNGKPIKNDIKIFSTDDSESIKTEKLNDLNSYFATVGRKIIEKIEHVPYYSDPDPKYTQFQLQFTDAAEVQRVISGMKSSKSQGFDKVDVTVFKRNSEVLAPKIAAIINDCIGNAKIDQSLKICRIQPVFKTGNKNVPGNYRPISILPVFDKIMSKIVNNQLTSHLEDNDVTTPSQYGFRRASNTQSALFDLITYIQKVRDLGKVAILIFLDMKKAFDTVHRKILLQQMNSIGVTGHAHEWFQEYLRNRTQYIQVDGQKSNEEIAEEGIPQVLKQIFYSMFQSQLTYGIGIWCTATQQHLKQLQVIQNKAIRNLFGEGRRISIKELHQSQKLKEYFNGCLETGRNVCIVEDDEIALSPTTDEKQDIASSTSTVSNRNFFSFLCGNRKFILAVKLPKYPWHYIEEADSIVSRHVSLPKSMETLVTGLDDIKSITICLNEEASKNYFRNGKFIFNGKELNTYLQINGKDLQETGKEIMKKEDAKTTKRLLFISGQTNPLLFLNDFEKCVDTKNEKDKKFKIIHFVDECHRGEFTKLYFSSESDWAAVKKAFNKKYSVSFCQNKKRAINVNFGEAKSLRSFVELKLMALSTYTTLPFINQIEMVMDDLPVEISSLFVSHGKMTDSKIEILNFCDSIADLLEDLCKTNKEAEDKVEEESNEPSGNRSMEIFNFMDQPGMPGLSQLSGRGRGRSRRGRGGSTADGGVKKRGRPSRKLQSILEADESNDSFSFLKQADCSSRSSWSSEGN
ncbi:RNA-directed DNA polymerase from mobile element jockey [Pseudolycoriella hygida]|uniref:RNA-directed DNA polymerase from mobile element jockey n=1 Tax=Pseudolycoriella hygida TaxID=35572 RepID=A0A9Q0N405_9DIPT|nr:RNA-directed DNA polymerase from mobile element jockey [Pseudolycoriella hygida]